MSAHLRKLRTVFLIMVITPMAVAQNAAHVYPGHPDFDVSIFKPFTAEYLQGQEPMTLQFLKTGEENGVFSTLMILPSHKGGVGIDLIEHRADDFSFVSRKYTLGAWELEYIDAEYRNDSLMVSRMPLPLKTSKVSYVVKKFEKPFFDGTFTYWLLAAIQLQKGKEFTMANWWITEKDNRGIYHKGL